MRVNVIPVQKAHGINNKKHFQIKNRMQFILFNLIKIFRSSSTPERKRELGL